MIRKLLLRVGMISLLLSVPVSWLARAQAADPPQLVISQFKITSSGGQFVTLYNQTDSPLNLGAYEIDYLNSSNKLSSLPVSGQLAAHGFYMLSDDQVRLCYQLTVNAVSLGFATTSGTLQVWQFNADKTAKQLEDSVTWASKATGGAVTLPAQDGANDVSLLRQPTDTTGNPQVATAASGSWQPVMPDATNPCVLNLVNSVTPVASPTSNPANQLGTGQAPPATIVSLAGSGDETTSAGASLPSTDIGLSAPQLTELLPNPPGTGNDAVAEFIELYNPNPVSFDLSGFSLQTGATTKHSYVFPAGTNLPPSSFTAFYSADTGLSLSNTSGQADMLDPFGNAISQTDAYGTAKDGLTWALANGKWYWTSAPTPGAANVIKQVTVASKSSTKTSTSKKGTGGTAGVKGATTTAGANTGSTVATDDTSAPPIHPYVLAAVATLAVGYGVYEYRHDLANRFHQFRSNRAARRQARR